METLFPTLPAELRYQIYTYLQNPAQTTASTATLPFVTKTYNTPHTTISLSTAHTGNLSLLSLVHNNILEAQEYAHYLLSQALELRIAIVFHGNLATFRQADWDEKIGKSLRKLIRAHGWISDIERWEVRIVMEPKFNGVALGRKKQGMMGVIADAMAKTVAESCCARSAGVRVRLCVPWALAVEKVVGGVRELGLDGFFSGSVGRGNVRREIREVVLGAKDEVKKEVTAPLVAVRNMGEVRDHGLIVVGEQEVAWSEKTAGTLIARTTKKNDRERWEVTRCEDKEKRQWLDASAMDVLRAELNALEHAHIVDY